MVDVMIQGFATHLEDLLQASRAISRQKCRLIRCRLIIDVCGLQPGVLQHRDVFKKILGLGKAYFPEVNATVTIIRAPSFFSRLFAFAKSFLTPMMRRKISILGNDFDAGLCAHAGLSRNALPMYLGGAAPDSEAGLALPVPTGARSHVNKLSQPCLALR